MIKQKSLFVDQIGCYIFFYLAIFGPKIGTLIDVSLISNLIVIIFVSKHCLVIEKEYRPMIRGLLVLILYSFLVLSVSIFSSSNSEIDYLFFLKFIRAIVALFAITAFVRNSKLEKETIFNCASTILLVHAITVIIGAVIWTDFQILIKPLSGFTKSVHAYRSTGLTNGYDFSGLLCCFGILVTYFGKKRKLSNIRLLIFIVSAMLTSRLSMLLAEAIIVYIVFINRKKERINKALLTTVLSLSVIPILGIVLFSTKNTDNPIVTFLMKNDTFSQISQKLIYYYASGTIDETIQGQYRFDSLDIFERIFGSMKVAHQDPGITQYIFAIGIIGLIIAVFTYLSILRIALRYKEKDKDMVVIVSFMIALCLVLSIKNSYLFARHVTECILVYFSLLTIDNRGLELEKK